jgi:hypothetical protein
MVFIRAVGQDEKDMLTGSRRVLLNGPIDIPVQSLSPLRHPESGKAGGPECPGDGGLYSRRPIRKQPASVTDSLPLT